jgi:hypothetical protein
MSSANGPERLHQMMDPRKLLAPDSSHALAIGARREGATGAALALLKVIKRKDIEAILSGGAPCGPSILYGLD